MKNMIVFSNPNFGAIRTAQTEAGEPLFIAVDICACMGYSNPRDAIAVSIPVRYDWKVD